jgi:hypothetical protein
MDKHKSNTLTKRAANQKILTGEAIDKLTKKRQAICR